MKTLLIAAALTLAALHVPSAVACEQAANPGAAPQAAQAAMAGAPHYQWQYHYVGHHSHLEGHWVLVN